jgi:hypothetical protein
LSASKIEGLTHLVIVAVVTNDVDRFDNVGMFECGADTKLCGDFLLVLLLGLTGALGPELLYGKYMTAVFVAGLDQAHGTTSTGAQDTAPLAIFFGNVSLGGLGQGIDDMWSRVTGISRGRML